MSKALKKCIDYFEDDEQLEEKIPTSSWELAEIIEQKLENKPRGKASKAWKIEVNTMIDEYNKNFGRSYSRV